MYTYLDLRKDISFVNRMGVEVFSIGATKLNRQIYGVRVGRKNGKQVIISGGIHAREHVSAYLVKEQLFYALKHEKEVSKFGGISFIPLVNPDGNMLCYEGLESVPIVLREELKRLNGGSEDFSLWKANAFGVDLNVNFDAKWGTGKQNIFESASQNYVGKKPFSEVESRALAKFTKKVSASATVSYHAAGKEMYWEFGQGKEDRIKDKKLAEYLNSPLQYKLLDDDGSSAGGYKDYCILKLKIPSFTIELVDDKIYPHPILDYSEALDDLDKHLDLPIRLLRCLK